MRRFKISVNGKTYEVDVEEVEGGQEEARPRPVRESIPREKPMTREEVPGLIRAPMPGSIYKMCVAEGDQVQAGDILMILEAMKMENEILAPREARVDRILVKEGDKVESGQGLISLS